MSKSELKAWRRFLFVLSIQELQQVIDTATLLPVKNMAKQMMDDLNTLIPPKAC